MTDATAAILAEARFNRGQFITADEAQALMHWSRWGTDGYPILKVKNGWTYNGFRSLSSPEVYKTKRAAVAAWEDLIDILIALKGLEQNEARNKFYNLA